MTETKNTTEILKTKHDADADNERSVMSEISLKNEDMFRNVFMNAVDGLIIIDRDFTILAANWTMEKILPEHVPLVGKKCYEASKLSHICVGCPVVQMYEREATIRTKYYKPATDTSPEMWFERLAIPIFEQVIGKISKAVVILRNISEQKDGKTEIQDYQVALHALLGQHAQELSQVHEQSELRLAKLNMISEITKIGIWDMEIEDNDLFHPNNTFSCSPEFRRLLGFSNDIDFPNTVRSFSNLLHPEDKDTITDRLMKHLLDKTSKSVSDVEIRLRRKTGEYTYFHVVGGSIRNVEGEVTKIAGFLMDISDMKSILFKTESQKNEAEAANKAKTEFLSKMSHEIRTPMNAILGITEMLLQNELLESDTKEGLGRIYNAGDLLMGIINDILDLSKIEAGKLELIYNKYDVASLINDAVSVNTSLIGNKPIEFILSVDENIPVVLFGDGLRIRQILNNLLSNAFKYTLAGTVKLTTFVEQKSNSEITLVFEVSDTGLGMNEEQISKLFEKYTRFNLKANRATEGTGLGMPITRNLVHMMNGTISVKSELDKGSVFTVRLPQRIVHSDVIGRKLADDIENSRLNHIKQKKRKRIVCEPMPYGHVLVVDDVETNLFVATRLLAHYDLSIDTAESGYEAIEKIKVGNVYDIIFMDHMMPGMDGIETVQIIRSLEYKHPIVALTANAVVGQAEIFLQNGFDDFISKPIDVRRLNFVLNKLIRNKQSPEVIEAARQAADAKRELDSAIMQPEINPQLREAFVNVARKTLAVLEAIIKKQGFYDDEDLHTYVIHVHGMKSALASIGKMKLSDVALKLEASARAGDTKTVATKTMPFLHSLREIVKILSQEENRNSRKTVENESVYLREQLLVIKKACEEYDERTAEAVVDSLREKTWTQQTHELLSAIALHLLHSDFDEVVEIVNGFLKIDSAFEM